MVKAGVQVLYHYLDDCVVLNPPKSKVCTQHLQILQKACNELAVPLASKKQEGPNRCLTFHGIIIDAHHQELRLPSEKLERILVTLTEWERQKSCIHTQS